jgi:predicted nucleic acid-binding protein
MPDCFIDTNIFIYGKGKDHPLKGPCVSLMERIRENEIKAIINTEIIQEILYRFQSIKKMSAGILLAREAVAICTRILPVAETDLSLALEILERHAATMINNGVKEIYSTDPHFDLIPEIRRLQPG